MRASFYICLIIAIAFPSCGNRATIEKGDVGNQIVLAVQSLIEEGDICFKGYDYKTGVGYYADAYNLSKRLQDSAVIRFCSNKYIWACYKNGDYSQAKNLLSIHKPDGYESYAVAVYIAIKDSLHTISKDSYKEAWALTTSLNDTINLLFIEAQSYSIANNFKKASEKYNEYASRIAEQNNNELLLQTKKVTDRYKYILIVFVIAASIITSTLIYFQKKMKNELNAILEVAKDLQDYNKYSDTIIEEKNNLITDLFKNQFKYINDLANNYYSYNASPSASSIMYNHVKKTLDRIAKENESSKNLENIINTYHENVIYRLKEQLPSLGEGYIKLYCYYCAGFSPQMISLLTNDSIDNIYKKKSRLKSRLRNSDAPDREFFIGLIFSGQHSIMCQDNCGE